MTWAQETTPYYLTVESSDAVGDGGTVYRFYANASDPTDQMSAVFGTDEHNLVINAPEGIWNSSVNSSWSASGINPAFVGFFPDLVDDSYATIGLTGPASASGITGAADPSIVEDESLSPSISGFFIDGGTSLNVNTLLGGSWYVLNTAANSYPVDGRWLVMQVTTTGSISGTVNYQIFPLGVGEDQVIVSLEFDGTGNFGLQPEAGCMDPSACNYDALVTSDDGSCDYLSCVGCTDALACNYDAEATVAANDLCVFCDCGASGSGYLLMVEEHEATALPGAKSYRLKVRMANSGDQMSAVFGVESVPMSISAPQGLFNSQFNTSWNASGITDAFLDFFPELADDSYATIGLTGPASGSALAGAEDPAMVQDAAQPFTPFFIDNGSTDLEINTITGGSWYNLNTASNTLPDTNNEVLIMQLTTTGGVSGTINVQVLPEGVSGIGNDVQKTFHFDGAGLYAAVGDGNACGCTDATSCNFDSSATYDDGSCQYDDALGECGGTCENDADADGICDDVDPCLGTLDACGVCNGPGAIYECGCTDIPVGDCDCNGNQLDALGECGGPCLADMDTDGLCDSDDGCVDLDACNFETLSATECDYCSCAEGVNSPVSLVLETHQDGLPGGMTSYRVYIKFDESDDVLTGVLGKEGMALNMTSTTQFFQDESSEFDSYVTVDGATPSVFGVEDAYQDFDLGQALVFEDPVGGGWKSSVPFGVAAGADLRVWVAQLTTDGDVSLSLQAQILNQGLAQGAELVSLAISSGANHNPTDNICGCTDPTAFNFNPEAQYDNGSCIAIDEGCMDELACNFDAAANMDDGTCLYLDALEECGGLCEEDADADGICDDVDACVGELDACGVCNGPGEIYECGCASIPEGDCDCDGNVFDECGICGGDGIPEGDCDCDGNVFDECGLCGGDGIPAGDCDCDGNQLDVLGECGGSCEADADADGICDDVDPCVGELDACGVCNGPGEIYECGCADIPEGDCDCDGNVFDECGICGGDGIPEGDCDCDGNVFDECGLCGGDGIPAGDCDCDGNILDECGICGGDGIPDGDCDCDGNQFDALGECGGPCEADVDADGICDDVDPCVGELDACGVCNGPGEIYECGCADIPEGDCDCDGNVVDGCGLCGGGTFSGCTDPSACNYDSQASCDDASCTYAIAENCEVCVEGNIYTNDADGDGVCDADEVEGCTDPNACNSGFFTNSNNDLCVYATDACEFCIAGNVVLFDVDGDGVCNNDEIPGCTDSNACNFDASATDDDGSCLQLDECNICGGDGIPAGDCDCDGNQLDALGECGGPCEADADADGICDDVDPCVGELDACGVCNGPGEIYECGCADIPEGDCDCDGNVLDECGICGGDGIPEGDCDCDGNVLDECGICGGDGIPVGYCDCDGNQLDALGECGGPCEADADADGICDDVDTCVGELDACGVCNGPGEIYECGCADILEGDCDCDGNQLDALGECGGPCEADADADGICDDVDTCVGELDACGVCNGPGEIYECGCADIPEGDCDCDGNQEDVIGECGGTCQSDDNTNGICDGEEVTVWDVISSNDSLLSTLAAAILVEGLDSALSSLDTTTAYTVFAPTDTAFAALLAELGLGADDLLADTTGLLANTLLYHVLGEVVLSTDMMDGDSYITLHGESVQVSVTTDSTGTTILINDATVIVTDVLAANGVVHIIDVLLMQPVLGCTNLEACNYDALATQNDGSCILVGDACDDADEGTINDIVGEDCECLGEGVTGVEEERWEWSLYPSPATDELRLTLAPALDLEGLSMEVMTSTGQVLDTQLLNGSAVLDVSSYPSGVYIVTLTNGLAERSSKRFVVTK